MKLNIPLRGLAGFIVLLVVVAVIVGSFIISNSSNEGSLGDKNNSLETVEDSENDNKASEKTDSNGEDSDDESVSEESSQPPKAKVSLSASKYVPSNPNYEPYKYNFTCVANTDLPVQKFYLYTSDGKVYEGAPTDGTDTYGITHTYAGPQGSWLQYNVKCVPIYDESDSHIPESSPYSANVIVTIGEKEEGQGDYSDNGSESQTAYEYLTSKIQPIDNSAAAQEAYSSYMGIVAAESDEEARPYIIEDEYSYWGGREDEDGNFEGWSDEGWSLEGFTTETNENVNKEVLILWFDVLYNEYLIPLGFIEEDNQWKFSPAATIWIGLVAGSESS